jgi:hypothetical protein
VVIAGKAEATMTESIVDFGVSSFVSRNLGPKMCKDFVIPIATTTEIVHNIKMVSLNLKDFFGCGLAIGGSSLLWTPAMLVASAGAVCAIPSLPSVISDCGESLGEIILDIVVLDTFVTVPRTTQEI